MKSNFQRTVYPVSLLVDQKSCLVVGGGKVAHRKITGLLEAGAAVTVVSPELDERLAELARAGSIRHVRREFGDEDVEKNTLVYAATGNKRVNRQVLAACRARRVFCCPVDGNWVEGDFVTPATLRKAHLTVSISTGGQSCRRSRLIKENLSRHLDMVDTADCVVLGTSHHQLDLKGREPFHLQGDRLEETGRMLMHVWGVHEFLLLDTCNRIELLAVKTRSAGTGAVLRKILGFDQLPPDRYYVKRGFEAFEHAALLAAGLLSQMPGENHIVSQVKEALALATQRGWAGGLVAEWMAAALHISKDIRQQIPSGLPRGEIEDASLRYVCRNVPAKDAKIVVLGTGVIGRGMVRRLAEQGRVCDWIYHRNAPDAAAVPAGVALFPWREMPARLRGADVVIVTTASPVPVLEASLAECFLPGRPVLLMDLSTPRNIDPELGSALPGAQLADLDVLKAWDCRASGGLEALLKTSRVTVHEHREMYEEIMRSFQSRDEDQ